LINSVTKSSGSEYRGYLRDYSNSQVRESKEGKTCQEQVTYARNDA
jgi:hypothetical protein